MYPIAATYELRDCPQKGNIEKRAPENLLKEESIGTAENVCRNEEYIFESSRDIEEIETIPAKTTILHTKKESIILVEEDPRAQRHKNR